MKGWFRVDWLVVYFDGRVNSIGWLRWLSDDGHWCHIRSDALKHTKPLPYFENDIPTERELQLLKMLEPEL